MCWSVGPCRCRKNYIVRSTFIFKRQDTKAWKSGSQGCISGYLSLERERGITIFSKQAVLEFPETRVTILDTPGHVDFSAEMERTLQVLDYAVLLINGADGVQGHTVTLWKLLERYQIPTFIFCEQNGSGGNGPRRTFDRIEKKAE